MKKIFTLALLALTVLSTNAATRKWDFTNWSAATVANLMAGAGQVSPSSNWSDIEKSTGTAPTETSANNCFWEVSAQGTTAGATVMANGQAIAELSGLYYLNTSSRSLAIAVNYPTALSDYHGGSYLWLGSSKKNYFVIPNVEPGSTIKMGVESHKASDARGVQLYLTNSSARTTQGTQLMDPDGVAVSLPTTYVDQTWAVPEADNITDTPNEDGTYDVIIYNTNGCHLYYITVQSGASTETAKEVAYIYNGNLDSDFAYIYLSSTTGINLTPIASSEAVTADIQKYDAIFVAPSVKSTDAAVAGLQEQMGYVPMVNASTAMYEAMGFTMTATAAAALNVEDKDSELFTNIDVTEGLGLFQEGTFPIWDFNLGTIYTYIATLNDKPAIVQNYVNRNSYLYLPLTTENILTTNQDILPTLLENAVKLVAGTKKDVTACAQPTATLTYADGSTTVALSCATATSVIMYSTDGTNYQLYMQPLTFTSDATVYYHSEAIGYTNSETASTAVSIMKQTATPKITVNGDQFSIEGDGTIYYNTIGKESTTNSTVYTGPVTVPFSCTITAFAIDGANLQSNSTSADVFVSAPYAKEIAHVNMKETWVKKDGSTVSKSTLNKKFQYILCSDSLGYDDPAYAQYATMQLTLKDQQGADSVITVHVNDSINTYSHIEDGNSWVVMTNGANMAFSTDGNEGVISVEGGTSAYGAADAFSAALYTKNAFTFGEIAHTRDAEYVKPSISSQQTYQAPFRMTAVLTGALGSGTCQSPAYTIDGNVITQRMEFCVSTDGTNWTVVDTISTTTDKMFEAKSVNYDGTDAVYVQLRAIMPEGTTSSSNRKINLSDIYIFGPGEADGIAEVSAEAPAKKQNNAIYNLSGQRVTSASRPGLYIQNGKKFMVK